MIKVYQAKREIFRDTSMGCNFDYFGTKGIAKAFVGGQYDLVAEVDTNSLDVAYERTNSIQGPWWDNEDVVAKFDGEGCRSTSVGDVVEVNGKFFIVDSFGFQPMTFRFAA